MLVDVGVDSIDGNEAAGLAFANDTASCGAHLERHEMWISDIQATRSS